MRKIAVALLVFGLFCVSAFAQSGRSRPRVIVTDNNSSNQNKTPAPTDQNSNQQTNQTDTTGAPADTAKRPPVLSGDTKSSSQPAANQADTGADDGEVIRVETNLVTIPVTVLDRDGRFISGLQKSDFHIFEDGAEQKIEYFAPVEQPFTVILLLDVSPSTEFQIDQIQDAAIAFVNQLRSEDRVMVMAFDERVHVLSPVTNNRYVLTNAIRQTNFGDGTSLYEAVDLALNRQLRQIEGRKAIVLFTDGVDTTSQRASYESSVRDAEEADALIYTVRFDTSGDMNSGGAGGGYPYPGGRNGGGLGGILGGILNGGGSIRIGSGGGNGGGRAAYETGRRYLEDLARTSGGREFEARTLSNIDAAFSGVADELRRQYSIGYYPETVGQAGQRKQIKVRADRQNAVVRAKNSYIVGEVEAKSNTKQQPKISNSRLPF